MRKNLKILLADDDERFLTMTAATLRRAGYSCACVGNASAAITLLEKETFALLIADVEMPGNTNLALIKNLQHIAPPLPVIVVTAQPSLDSAILSIQLQVGAYLIKPFESQQLVATVRNLLGFPSLQRTVHERRHACPEWGANLDESKEDQAAEFSTIAASGCYNDGGFSTEPPAMPYRYSAIPQPLCRASNHKG